MKLLITGSRKCVDSDYEYFEDFLNDLIIDNDLEITEMIHGRAKGADQFADRYARVRMIPTDVYKPNYDKYGSNAPLVRNVEMVDLCDICVAIYKQRKTSGTLYTATKAKGKINWRINFSMKKSGITLKNTPKLRCSTNYKYFVSFKLSILTVM
jgi:hypothetical protein